MIPRILVPKNARPVAGASDAPPGRLSSPLDTRTIVPPNLPHIELDTRTTIPAYFPLEVLGSRTVVPRDMPTTPIDATSNMPDYVPLTILDSRVAVPKDAHAPTVEPKLPVPIQDLPDVLDPDVLTTGEVILMARPMEERTSPWNLVARITSIAFHFAVILLILFERQLFPYRPPTEAEISRNITRLYLPSYLHDIERAPVIPTPKGPQIRVDPRILRQLAPPRVVQPAPAPEPEHIVRDIPAPIVPTPQPRPQPQADSPIRPPQQQTTSSLVLPRFSPGKALEESIREAQKNGGTSSAQFGGPLGPAPGGGGIGGGGGGGGQGYLGGAVTLLTPTEGVDFTAYLNRVLASVKRNWYAVIPESARLGEQGRVVLQFHIMRNGVVPDAEPAMVSTSGRDPLDRAALSSIRASTPFEPLPPAFSGPYIELRFIFLYNLPLSAQ
jgi:TonB family protein